MQPFPDALGTGLQMIWERDRLWCVSRIFSRDPVIDRRQG